MNSPSVHICQGPLPVASPRLTSTISLSYGSLSVSQSSKRSHLASSNPLHMNSYSRLHRSLKEKNKNNILRGERGGSLAMACSVLGALSLISGKMNSKKKASILACGGGQGSNAAEEGSVTGPLKKLIAPSFFQREPNDNEIEALKLYAMALSKDNLEEAEEILNKERQHWVAGEADDKLLMALVELLVYREEYDKAREKIEELGGIVKAHQDVAGISTMWTKFYLLKAIVESVNEARQKVEEEEEESEEGEVEIEEDDTNKAKEELWLIYCRKVKESDLHRSFRR